jgi:glycoprotein endo-alpha-1,2-mannosidase
VPALVIGRALRIVALGLVPVALAVGIWRVERDGRAPAWRSGRHASLPAPAAAAGAPGALPRLVLAVHYTWYGTPGGPTGRWRHWNHARLEMPRGRVVGFHDPRREAAPGRLALGAAHYPLDGPYDSTDVALIRAQLGAAREGGLDGFAVSWWGRESRDGRALSLLFREARDTGLVLAPYYETGELWRRGAAGVAADLVALLDRHGTEPGWLRVGGAPVVFLYASHRLRPHEWDGVRARLDGAGRRLFLVADVPRLEWLAARPGWLQRFDALHVYTPVTFLAAGRDLLATYGALAAQARAARRPFVPAVAPGFDDRRIRDPGVAVDRANGDTYARTWQAALATDPAWVLVATWNEWHEGSEIEPSREHGRRYLDLTRAWAERFRRGRAS